MTTVDVFGHIETCRILGMNFWGISIFNMALASTLNRALSHTSSVVYVAELRGYTKP